MITSFYGKRYKYSTIDIHLNMPITKLRHLRLGFVLTRVRPPVVYKDANHAPVYRLTSLGQLVTMLLRGFVNFFMLDYYTNLPNKIIAVSAMRDLSVSRPITMEAFGSVILAKFRKYSIVTFQTMSNVSLVPRYEEVNISTIDAFRGFCLLV